MQNDTGEEENKVDGSLSAGEFPILNYFFQRYPPASSFKEADLTLTTDEISQRIAEHSGTTFPTPDLYQWLIEKGYHQDSLADANFTWLIKDGENF